MATGAPAEEPPAKRPRAEQASAEGGKDSGHENGHGHESGHGHKEEHGHGEKEHGHEEHGKGHCCDGHGDGHAHKEGHGEGHAHEEGHGDGHERHGEGHGHGGHGGEHGHGEKGGHGHDCCDGHGHEGHEGGHKGHEGGHGHEDHGHKGHAGGGHEAHGHEGHGEGHEEKPHASGFHVPAVVTERASNHAAWRTVFLPEEARGGMLLSPALKLGPDMRLRRSDPGYKTGYHHAVAAPGGCPVLLLVLQGRLAIDVRTAGGSEERVFGPGECFVAADRAPCEASSGEAGDLPGGHAARVVGSEPLLAAHVKLGAECMAHWFSDSDVLI